MQVTILLYIYKCLVKVSENKVRLKYKSFMRGVVLEHCLLWSITVYMYTFAADLCWNFKVQEMDVHGGKKPSGAGRICFKNRVWNHFLSMLCNL